jgi:hypothetical protein
MVKTVVFLSSLFCATLCFSENSDITARKGHSGKKWFCDTPGSTIIYGSPFSACLFLVIDRSQLESFALSFITNRDFKLSDFPKNFSAPKKRTEILYLPFSLEFTDA